MRGLSLACLLLLAHGSFSAPQEEGDAATTTAVPATTADPATTTAEPVSIKYINEINEDGSYTVGYEASDGTFKMETRDVEGNVEGKYGVLTESGEIKVIEYSSNNSTGFTTNNEVPQAPVFNPEELSNSVLEDPAFVQERARHQAVLDHQKRVIEKQNEIQAQNELALARQSFANQRNQGQRRPVFNAANFNPNAPISSQFDQQSFNQDFNRFNQQQQFATQQQQFAPQQQQQFAPRQQQQFVPQQQFAPQQQQQQFIPQQQQQQLFAQQEQFRQQQGFVPQQQQQQSRFQFTPRAQAQQQFLPQQQQSPAPQFVPRPTPVPVSQLTREQIALQGFSRDDDQDGQIDPLPAHLLPASVSQPIPQQSFAPRQQFQSQQAFAPQQQQVPAFQQQAAAPQAQQSFQALQQQQAQFFTQQQAAAAQQQQLAAQRQQFAAAQQQFAPQQQQQFAPQQQQQFAPQQFAPQQQQQFAPQQRPQFRAPQPVAPTSAAGFNQLTALLQQ